MSKAAADAKAYCAPLFDGAAQGALDTYRGLGSKAAEMFPMQTLNLKRTLKGHVRKVMCVAWKDNPREPPQLVAADQNHKVILWDAKSGMKKNIYSASFVMTADVHPTRDVVAIGSMQNVCAIVDMSTNLAEGQQKRALEGHDGYVGSVKWIEGGNKLVSAGGDAAVMLWDPEKGKEISTMYGHDIDAGSISFPSGVQDSPVFCTGSTDKTVKMWDLRLANNKNACVMTFNCEGEVNCCAMFPNGNAVVAGCETCERSKMENSNKAPEPWEETTGAATFFCIRSGATLSKYTRKKAKCTNVCWSQSGRILFVSYEDGQVGMWDPWAEGGIKHKIPAHVVTGAATEKTTSVVSAMSMAPTGDVLATAGFDGLIKVWGPGD